jgi:glucose/arabinose dehydrogenase
MGKHRFSMKRAGLGLAMITVPLVMIMSSLLANPAYGVHHDVSDPGSNEAPQVLLRDKSLIAQTYVSGLDLPMTMAFVEDDILVVERTAGNVRLIRDGELQPDPVLSLNVSSITGEEGLLGIFGKGSTVYISFTTRDSENKVTTWFYRYNWDGSKLTDPVMLKEIPGGSGLHNGGAITVDANGTVYGVMADQWDKRGVLQNHPDGGGPDDTSVIFPLEWGDSNDYYAIGIRMSLGLAVDPVTGYMWDTENGGATYDEINLVTPKFNSGWDVIMGPANSSQLSSLPRYDGYTYHDPRFSWEVPVGILAPTFVTSDIFEEYQDSVLVGDFHTGTLYELKLNEDRTGFAFEDPSLVDLVLNKEDNSSTIVFGTGFTGITDIEQGPDGLIYVVSIGDGTIYRIAPKDMVPSHNIPSHFK